MKASWRTSTRTMLDRALAFVRSAEPRSAISRHSEMADAIVAAAAGAAAALTVTGTQPYGRWLVQLLFILTAVPLAWRRVFPLTAFWANLAAVSLVAALGVDAGLITFLTVAFAAYTAVAHSRFRGAALISMPVAAGLIMAAFADTAPPIPARATPMFLFLPIMIVGNAVYLWRRRAGDAQTRLRQAEAEHEAATRVVLEQERARIASELHDVVTHNVSVMMVQTGAARQILTGSPCRATEALLAVESSGRAALTELRHLLGLLSPASEYVDGSAPDEMPGFGERHMPTAVGGAEGAASLQPQPGLASLRPLIDRAEAAGLPVELAVQGRPRPLPPGLELAAFRVVQEALTNVLKHAGLPQTEVTVCYRDEDLVVQVADEGRPIPVVTPAIDEDAASLPVGARRGLLGLRERVALYGGHLDAGQRQGGGWEVMATIPVDHAEAPTGTSPA